jgi:hypothetical protein
MGMEEWKDIPNYEGLYQASSEGRIRTVEGKTTSNAIHKERHWKSRIMKGRGDNYITGKRVGLWKDGKCKDFLVARLVALTFLGDPPDGYTVNHKDGNRMNNAVFNLEWLSLADNIRHGFDTGLYAKSQKRVRLITSNEVLEFRSRSEASRYLGRNSGYVSLCISEGRQAVSKQGITYEIKPIPRGETA